ncbi:MAG: GGDEF domain-containing protein [Bacilli bacterium]|nr:GGDEF domain-containing protein [Bacilli bacterium]
MITVTITANFVSAAFLILVIGGSYRVSSKVSEKIKTFRICAWITFAGLIIDAVAYLMYGTSIPDIISTIVTFLAFALIDAVIVSYSFYMYSEVKEKDPSFHFKFPIISLVLAAADFTLLLIGTITGNLFTVVNGVYTAHEWTRYAVIVPLTSAVAFLIFLITQAKSLGVKNALVLGIYLVVPITSGLLTLRFPSLELGYVGTAIALMTIYVVIHARYIAESQIRAVLYDEISKKDVLTGLANRRAYVEALESIDKDERVGVIFCDINCLKTVNDNEGHDAGDRLIQRVARILVELFPDQGTYRISGDEFIVVFRSVDESKFQAKTQALEKALSENGHIASFGHEVGKGEETLELIKSAERMMYDRKKSYYAANGIKQR